MSRPVHFEIHAGDPGKLAKFYAEVFGWRIQHMPQFDYWLIDSGSEGPGINGGLVRRRGSARAPDAPVNAYVCSLGIDSVDSYLEKALKAGATVALPKMTIRVSAIRRISRTPTATFLVSTSRTKRRNRRGSRSRVCTRVGYAGRARGTSARSRAISFRSVSRS